MHANIIIKFGERIESYPELPSCGLPYDMIETDRLILRPWRESDAEALFRYASDPDVGPRAGWPPHKDIEESRNIIRDIFTNERTWAITLKETGEATGFQT